MRVRRFFHVRRPPLCRCPICRKRWQPYNVDGRYQQLRELLPRDRRATLKAAE